MAAGDTLLAPEITRRLLEEYVRRPPLGAAPLAPLTELTERELDVLRLIARGRSNSEIATALFVSEPTIKIHINRVFRKLGVRDRIQAVVFAYDTGLVRPGEGGGAIHPDARMICAGPLALFNGSTRRGARRRRRARCGHVLGSARRRGCPRTTASTATRSALIAGSGTRVMCPRTPV